MFGRRSRVVGALAALAPLAVVAACAGEAREDEPGAEPRVVVLGADGFEWSVILPLMKAGRMPHLLALMERGTSGTLATLDPTLSPRLWTTIATGQPPEVHGILGFVEAPDEAGERATREYDSRDRVVKAYWDILGDYGITSDTIGWWMTYPTDEVRGLMVAQVNTLENKKGIKKGGLEDGVPGQVWPRSEEERVFELRERQEAQLEALFASIFGKFPELPRAMEKRWKQCAWAFLADSTYLAVLKERARRNASSRVTSVYVGGTDVVGHRFWSAHDPVRFGLDADDPEVALFGHVIEAYYEYTDRVLGELVALFPEDTTFFVIADHGMSGDEYFEHKREQPKLEPKNTGGHQAQEPGVFVAAGTGIRRTGLPQPLARLELADLPALGGLADFCPTLLALVDVPFGESMQGRPLERLFDPAWLAAHPLASVPTHDDPEWLARRAGGARSYDAERIDQLENLGYLGEQE